MFLHYYLEKDDVNPRKSLDLTGCSVDVIKSVVVGDMEYFPFIVSHPKSTKSYNLASLSKKDTELWMSAISKAASRPTLMVAGREKIVFVCVRNLLVVICITIATADTTPSTRLLSRRPLALDEEAVKELIVNSDDTLASIPKKYAPKVESAVETILNSLETTEGWEQLYEKKGLVAYRKSGFSGSSVCVRGDVSMPFDIVSVFSFIYDLSKASMRDPQLNDASTVKAYSVHTSVQYLKYKQVTMTYTSHFTFDSVSTEANDDL